MLQKWRKGKRDNRGLTLVELMCAIAILGLIGATVSGVMVVSAQSYQRGAGEIELQQEAQIAVNQIADLVIDTTALVTTSEDGIAIEQGDSRYEIKHVGTDLKYYEWDGSDPVASDQLMAQYVEVFTADASDFSNYGILRLSMELKNGDRTYAANFTITARNGQILIGEVTAAEEAATIITETELVLEPNEVYGLSATVVGPSDAQVRWNLSGNTTADTQVLQHLDDGKWYLHVGEGETGTDGMNGANGAMLLTVEAYKLDENGNIKLLDTESVTVYIRRVRKISVSGILSSGTPLKRGATYRVTADITATNGSRFLGLASDENYITPYTLTWSYELKDSSNNVVSNIENYISWSENADLHYTTITLKQDLDFMTLTVTAVASHPEGKVAGVKTNKTEEAYGHEEDSWTLSSSTWKRGGSSPSLLAGIDIETVTETNEWTGESWTYRVDSEGNKIDSVGLDWYLSRDGLNWSYWTGQSSWDPDGTNMGLIPNGGGTDWWEKYATESLEPGYFSYSSPYYMLPEATWDSSVPWLKVEIKINGQTYSKEFKIEDVAFSYRNSNPNDGDDGWSPELGSHIVYVTPEDSITDYTSYFRLLNGWDEDYRSEDGRCYLAYNLFVGVIEDNEGYANDICHDLTFVDKDGNLLRRGREVEAVIGPVDGGWNSDVITCYAVPQYAPHRLADDIKEIGGGSDKNCTLTVRITQEEKEALCANGGTVIKEIYEYNYFFGAGVIRDSGAISSPNATWYFMSDAQKAAFEAVDGCNGILEFRFMPANVVITTNAGNKPAVMYCPLYGRSR